jgi:hypothetical protein
MLSSQSARTRGYADGVQRATVFGLISMFPADRCRLVASIAPVNHVPSTPTFPRRDA